MMLLRDRIKGKRTDITCLELINEGGKEDVKINFLSLVNALLRTCKDLQLNIITTISRRGYRTIIVMSSKDDLTNCKDIAKMFIEVYSSKKIKVEDVVCTDFLERALPF
ncbi:MAG: hypothetical protein QXO98_05875 [Sulfolobales archaeon]